MSKLKISSEMMSQAIRAVKTLPQSSFDRMTEYMIKVALTGALNPLVYRAHPDTRVVDRRTSQTHDNCGKGYYRIGTDQYYPNNRQPGRDRRRKRV